MKSYHDVSHVCVIDTNGQHEVARFAVALSHQEATVLAFVQQQFLSVFADDVTVKPPGTTQLHLTLLLATSSAAAVCQEIMQCHTLSRNAPIIPCSKILLCYTYSSLI